MTEKISRQDLLSFLDFLADKGLAKRSTVVSRKAAVNTLLSILDDAEASNLQAVDVEDLLRRFANIKGQEFKPASLQVYKSRLNTVLDEYKRYKANPTTYKPQSSGRDRDARPRGNGQETQKSHPIKTGLSESERTHAEVVEEITFPIPIRRGIIVRVTGIPSDLTPDEASKIGNVILALSGSQEE